MLCLRQFFRREDGATAVEYAFVAPILILFLMGTLEYCLMMYASAVLDGAVTAAAREGKTGYVNTSSSGTCPSPVINGTVTPQTQAQYINCFVGARVSGLLNSSLLQISYNDTGSSSFSGSSDTPTFTATCTNNPALANPPTLPLCSENAQTAGDIVIYTVRYPWTILTPVMKQIVGNNGIFTLSASAVVKNEPYPVQSR